nr:hypothetical protein [Lentzea waywayandensis]
MAFTVWLDDQLHTTGVFHQSLSLFSQLQRLRLPSVTGQTQRLPEEQLRACGVTPESGVCALPVVAGRVVAVSVGLVSAVAVLTRLAKAPRTTNSTHNAFLILPPEIDVRDAEYAETATRREGPSNLVEALPPDPD